MLNKLSKTKSQVTLTERSHERGTMKHNWTQFYTIPENVNYMNHTMFIK